MSSPFRNARVKIPTDEHCVGAALFPLTLVLGLVAGCTNTKVAPVADAPKSSEVKSLPAKVAQIEKLATRHLTNAVRVHDRVISGGLPEGDQAFAELQSLGVKTVISVDGAKPDIETAAKHGLRYVHLPHGYDGVPERRAKELAKAVRELPGQIYIHCHHGKHRSPAASAVACVSAGLIRREEGLNVLAVAGTSQHYRGLFESATAAHPLDEALLDQLQVDFPSIAKLPEMAEAMVEIEHAHEHLKALEKGSWKVLSTQPDLVPAHEALLLREHFTELLRTDEVKQQPDRFQELMRAGEANAQQLEDALRDWSPMKDQDAVPDTVAVAMKKVAENCKACHEQYRDVPLSEKAKTPGAF